MCFSLSKKNTSVILSITLETLAPVATSNDDYDILHQIDYHDIPRGEGLLRPDIDLLPAHAIERTTETENPDIVQRLEPVSASGYPRFVQWSTVVCAKVVCDTCGRECWARPAACQDVE